MPKHIHAGGSLPARPSSRTTSYRGLACWGCEVGQGLIGIAGGAVRLERLQQSHGPEAQHKQEQCERPAQEIAQQLH
ncbi:hypothetical protein DUNSADRAFT_15521 [Dunaliella salina]|uniref:Encoded protein n=1 Tax=Dunaliella salina TaxID=3046 RepID=A0ABQ7G5A0_DUNSA|nr:hypothetical protein DUNSADRAFT_15521 [Dunaliella salina]|eukprot:KAF5829775.1 hypothetical protein DUNSADRAFT_15521 [Dunaliella salina]